MPKKKPYARIAITLPQEVLAAADRLAKQLDRSRSWVIAEAVRRYATGGTEGPGTAEVAEARRRHLVADLRLTPPERLRRVLELVELGRRVTRPRPPRTQVIGFDSYEDFYRWKTARLAGA